MKARHGTDDAGQAYEPAVAGGLPAARDTGLVSPVHRQAGKPALHLFACLLGLFVIYPASGQLPFERDRDQSRVFLADNIARPLRYTPDGTDFVITNGSEYFNRPLYSGNTAFRVDGGDKPEFSLYLPGRGGNLRPGIRTTWRGRM